jgi:hypothetical protein
MNTQKKIKDMKKMLKYYQGIAREQGRVYSQSIQEADKLEKEIRLLENSYNQQTHTK